MMKLGYAQLLSLLFITLKLTHYIDWDWKWVLAPVWIPAVIVIALFPFAFTIKMLSK